MDDDDFLCRLGRVKGSMVWLGSGRISILFSTEIGYDVGGWVKEFGLGGLGTGERKYDSFICLVGPE